MAISTTISKVTIANVNAKAGSIVITPVTGQQMPQYFMNLKSFKLTGDNPFLADGSTLNPQASVSLFSLESNTYVFQNLPLSNITTIGGTATPATLALTLAAIAALIAE